MRTWFSNIFVFGFLLLLSSLNPVQCNEDKKKVYYRYLRAVTQHFQKQDIWKSMKHITIEDYNSKTNLSIEEALGRYLMDNRGVAKMYNKIAQLINYRYAEILHKFCMLLLDVTNECQYFYQMSSFENFMYCIISLRNILKYSHILFDNLYNALTFLSLIDVKFLTVRCKNYSEYIVDELYCVKNYVHTMDNYFVYIDENNNPIIEKAYEFLQSVENLCVKIIENLTGIPSKNSGVNILYNNENNLKQIYEKNFSGTYQNFIRFLSVKLKTLMDNAQIEDFVNLGFQQLLYPTSME